MLINFQGYSVAAAALLASSPVRASAIVASTPTISGNGWVALGLLTAFAGVVYMLIMGALHVERRDARLGRHVDRDEHGWFGVGSRNDDDDHPGDGSGN
jgi:hypothetical protein